MIPNRHHEKSGLSIHKYRVSILLMSVEYIAYFESNLGVSDLVLASIRFFDIISPRILGWAIFEEFFESLKVVRLDLFLNKDSHSELLGNNDFIGRNSSITGYYCST